MRQNQSFEQRIKDAAQSYQIPEPDRERKKKSIQYIIEMSQLNTSRTNSYEFVREQRKFIRKRTWLCQILALTVLYFFAVNDHLQYIANQSYILVSSAAPFLFLLMVDEFGRLSRSGIVELELTTIHTPRLVALSRFLILGISDLIMIVVFSTVTAMSDSHELLRFAVYSIVPFLLCSFILLCISNHYYGERFSYAVSALAFILIVFLVIGGKEQVIRIYQPEFLKGWLLIGTVSLLLLGYECRKMFCQINEYTMYV